jgi:hypothetical protein
MLARIREGMPNVARRHDIEQDKISNAGGAQRRKAAADVNARVVMIAKTA